ncbi:MAG: hypothetical protein HOL85_20120 [Rhodospirillaceae bacterium]|nr:hypothetical protein [Rhodospirillaceae bacterium]
MIEETSDQRDLMDFFPYPFQTRVVDSPEEFKDVLRDTALSDYDFILPSGYITDCFAATIGTGENYRVEQCGEDDFRRLLNYMVEETTDTPTWRPYRSAAMDGSGVFSWPPPISMGHNFI